MANLINKGIRARVTVRGGNFIVGKEYMCKLYHGVKIEHIIRTIVAAICVAVLAWMLQGCKTPQPIVQTEVKEVVVEREVRDTIVTILPDSASIKALLECDSAGNVLIRELEETQGKNMALELLLRGYKNNHSEPSKPITELIVDCKQDSLQRVVELQNEKISKLSNNKQVETIEVKYIPDFVKWLAWIGGAAIVLALIIIALWIYKKFFLK